MIIVRNCFIAKPGQASKLAAQLKEAAGVGGMQRYRVLTDLVGDMNNVVFEYEVDSLTDFEATMRNYQTNAAFRDKMKGYADLYLTGRREFLQTI